MATRAAIARLLTREPLRWEGVYHHWDGYPTCLGRFIFESVRGQFQGDVAAFLEYALSHDGGWSHIYPSAVIESDPAAPEGYRYGAEAPQCYCHGYFAQRDAVLPGSKAGWLEGCSCHQLGEDAPCDPLFIEWVYALDPEGRVMAVLASTRGKDGHCQHALKAIVPLDGPEPDWEAIEASR